MSKSIFKTTSNYFFILIFLFLVFNLSACTIAKISGRGPIPIVLNNLPTKVKVISHFKENKIIAFDYTSSFDLSEVIADKLSKTKADAAINVVVKIETDPATFLVNLITLGIANARRIEVEGDLVKIEGNLSSITQHLNKLTKVQKLKEYKLSSTEISSRNKILIPFIVKTHNKYIVIDQ